MFLKVVDIADIKCPLISISGHSWTVGKQAVTVQPSEYAVNNEFTGIYKGSIRYGKSI
jgi:hypothetical protein